MIKVLPNQNVKFSLAGQDFNSQNAACFQDNELWCQLAEPQVTTQFEGELTPVTGDELVERNTFDGGLISPWVVTSGTYTIPAGNAVRLFTYPGATEGGTRQPITFTPGRIYRFGVQITESDNADLLLTFYGTGTYMSTYFFPDVQPGYYQMYFLADAGTTGIQINVISHDSTNEGYFTMTVANLVELSTPTIAIYDCDGNFAHSVTDIQYQGERFAVSIPWGELGLEANCYKICMSDVDDLNEDLLLPSLFIIASNGQPLLAGFGDTNVNTLPSFKDRVNTKVDPLPFQGNTLPVGIKYMG